MYIVEDNGIVQLTVKCFNDYFSLLMHSFIIIFFLYITNYIFLRTLVGTFIHTTFNSAAVIYRLYVINWGNEMKFSNYSIVSIGYNMVIQLTSKLLDIGCIVDKYYNDSNKCINFLRMGWFTKLWGIILWIKHFWILKRIEVAF